MSLKCMIDKWLHKGQISQEEYDAVIKKLDGHDAEIKGQTIRDVLETVKEQNEIYLAKREKQIRADAIEEFVRWAYVHGIDFSFMGKIKDDGTSDVPERLQKIKNDFWVLGNS